MGWVQGITKTKMLCEKSTITLPNCNTSERPFVAKAKLSLEMVLQDVLYVPVFKWNLLSIPKLTRES